MTIKAAGIMILCRTDDGETALFVKRGAGSDYPGMWAFPGGRCEDGETLEECAERETREEIGAAPYSGLAVWTRRVAAQETTGAPPTPLPGESPAAGMVANVEAAGGYVVEGGEQVDFTTFAARTKAQFTPKLGDEHTGWAWARIDQPPEPLHPGCRIALARLTMDELGIARAMAAGELAGPQKYQNLWLFPIRITGTGMAYRTKWKEYVWRDSSLYLNDEFLARIAGLPVIWEHPPTDVLDSKEYAKRVIGAVMLPYIKGEDVWAVVRVHDEEAAQEMANEQLSTSPAVVLRDADATKLQTENGETILVEGKPTLVDHIAVCGAGVWDKQGPPTGVDMGDLRMAADDDDARKKADDEKARKDAEAGEKIDKILSHLDSVTKRMDAMETSMAADRKRRDDDDAKRRADAAKKRFADDDDDARRKRADDAAESCKDDDDDDAFKKRMDAEENEEREEREREGEAKEVAADKARHHRADKEKWRADRRKKRADDDAKRKDDDDAKKRADSILASNADLAARIANMPKALTDADYAALAGIQARADSQAYQPLGLRAPGPLQGETALAYRVRLARGVQAHSKPWSGVDLHALQDVALGIAETQIYADAQAASNSPDGLPEFALVPRQYTDPDTGHRITEWRGRHTFIHGLKRPSKRAERFNLNGRGN